MGTRGYHAAGRWLRAARLMRFDNGALVLSGGRLSNTNRDVIVWLNAEGDGAWWQAFSISYRHNLLETNASLHFTPTLNASNYRQSMSYTSLVRTGPRTGFVTYGRRPGRRIWRLRWALS